MDEPKQEVIDRLKSQHSERSLHLISLIDGAEEFHFLMTGPNRVEYQKYTDDIIGSKDAKTDKDRLDKARLAVEKAALAQIRWPDRDEVKTIFDNHPLFVDRFLDELEKAAGGSFEVKSKKL